MTADDEKWADRPTPDDAAIEAAHPLAGGDGDRYRRALEMVEARHSKYALVDLVNWLLARAETAEAKAPANTAATPDPIDALLAGGECAREKSEEVDFRGNHHVRNRRGLRAGLPRPLA